MQWNRDGYQHIRQDERWVANNFMGQVSLTRSKGLSTKAKDQMEPAPQQVASFEIMFWMKWSKTFTKLSN